METHGADSLSASVAAGELVTLPGITSIARSLGVTRVSEKTWEFAQRSNVRSVVLSNAQAAMACVRFAAEERIVVEPACGVSVAACYEQTLREVVPGFSEESRVVIIVCGGEHTVFFCFVENKRNVALLLYCNNHGIEPRWEMTAKSCIPQEVTSA